MKTNIFHLAIIPTSSILPHEKSDAARAKPLAEKIKKEGILSNPIIVSSLGKGKYLQLDGMNRFTAFQLLGFTSILAQIIDYNDQENIELSSWCHLLYSPENNFLDQIASNGKITIKEGNASLVGHRYIREEGMGRLCTVINRNGKVYLIHADGSLLEKLDYLNRIVSIYENNIARDALPQHPNWTDIDLLFKEHYLTNFMIVFPTFTRHQIIEFVRNNQVFPPGITRHILKRRCLNLNIPLKFFTNTISLEERNKRLDELLKKRRFRLYEEPTIYFE